MEDNAYIEFANWYYAKLSEMAKDNVTVKNDYLESAIDPRVRPIFKSVNSIKEEFKAKSDKVKTDYHWEDYKIDSFNGYISRAWNYDLAFADWILEVKKFIDFIRYSEKCFMYKNESSIDREARGSIVYVEDKENTLYIRDFLNDIKIKVSFVESMVNDIIIDTTSNSLADYVESGKTPKRQITVEFIDITLVREFGKELTNQFRFMISENPKYNDESDKVLMDVIRSQISMHLKSTFYEIFDNYIREFSGFSYKLKLGDVLDGRVLFGF